VDQPSHTLFVANQAAADEPGTVSVVDTTVCNGTNTSGCGLTPARISTALSPRALALDPARRVVYTANLADASSSFFSAALCNARNPAGCALPARRVATGNGPTDVVFDASTSTVYVADAFVSPPASSARGIVSLYGAR
jgi:DNA-binding beta-propeller fold protein YncE